jgi:acetolactate synthase I/II/III large subunit
LNGAEALLRTLVSNGIGVCFMNPGTSEMQFVAALDQVPAMRGVLCLYEGVCSGAADGYARMTRTPASTLLHLGPGLANALSNFHNARKALSPVVSIVGEHSTQHLAYDAPLTADVEAFARTVSDATDVFYVRRATDVGALASQCIAAAVRPPGQVSSLIVPADHSWSEAGLPGPVVAPAPRRVPDVRDVRLDGTCGLLLSGSALIGRGLTAAARVSARTGARIFANRNAARMESGRGRFQPQRVAYFPEPAEAQLSGLKKLFLIEAKAPVSFFGYPGRRSTLAPEDCEIVTLASPEEDGAAVLEQLAGSEDQPWVAAEGFERPAEDALSLDVIGYAVARHMPENAVVSDETISAGETMWRWLLRAAPHDHLPVTGGSIGQGLPVAVGAAIACPDRKVVALEADGSAMYTLSALWTMARERLDVVVVVFANRRYRILDVEMERTGARGFGAVADSMIDIGRPDLDFVRLSQGMGVEATRASTAQEFIDMFAAAMRERGPRLIEAVLP